MHAKGHAAVYTRSATKGMDTDPTEAQRHAAYDFADKENLKIVKCVDDIGTSGIRHFPTKLREFILWASENNVSDLIVYSSDRITRNAEGMREFFNSLDETSITPRFVAGNFPDDPDVMCDALTLQSFVTQFGNRERAKHIRTIKGNAP